MVGAIPNHQYMDRKIKYFLTFFVPFSLVLAVACFLGILKLTSTYRIEKGLQLSLYTAGFVLLLMFGIGVYIVAKISDGSGTKQQGTAKFSSLNELNDLKGTDGFRISKNFKMSLKSSFEHVLILGPTGSGKSTSFFIPNMLELDGKASAIVTDPKGEIYEISRDWLLSQGYRLVRIYPLAPPELYENKENCYYRYNPLFIAETVTEIKEIAQLIMINSNKSYEIATGSSSGNAEWLAMATPLLSAGLIYTKYESRPCDINSAVDFVIKNDDATLEAFTMINDAAYNEFLIYKQSAKSPQTASSIRVTLSNAVQLFFDPNVSNFLADKTLEEEKKRKKKENELVFNLRKELLNKNSKFIEGYYHPLMLREQPTAVFVQVPEHKSIYMMPLMSIFFQQTLNILLENKEGMPVLFLLDEFANIGVIPNIANVCATARSRRIGIAICLQGIEQLERNYGQHNASDILNNLKTQVILSGLKERSAEYVSKLSGYTSIETRSTSYSLTDKNKNETVSEQRRELLTPDEVRRMPSDKVLIIAHNKNPVFDTKIACYKDKFYLDRYSKHMRNS